MENIIFYFTGTGNSLAMARDIANRIGDTKVVSITDAIMEEKIELPYKRIGFVFPIYYSNAPAIVKTFIEKLNFNKSQYIFGIMTYGGTAFKIMEKLNHYITGRGGTLSAGFMVHMPGNYIVKYGAFPGPLQKILLKGSRKKAEKISAAVMEKKVLFKGNGEWPKGKLADLGNEELLLAGEKGMDFHVNSNCTGCATCVRLCPVNNIKLENKQPKWGFKCEQCVACIQWCPAHAIEHTDKTAKRKRYHHPDIKVSDLIK